MNINAPVCLWEKRVPPTMRDNSVQPSKKHYKYLPLQITEYEYKPTWLPLGKGAPPTTRDNSVQLPLEERLHIHVLALLCHNHADNFMNCIQCTCEIFAIKANNRI